jgi:hypothetical protein
MYLEPWMIATLCLAFGACAYISSRRGFAQGGEFALQLLVEKRMIKITDEGEILRWTPYDDKPKRATRKKK